MTRSSQKKRKRNHRRLPVEAITRGPKLCGGWGSGLPTSRGDFLLVRKAIHEGWPVSAEVKQIVIDAVGQRRPCESDSFPHELGMVADKVATGFASFAGQTKKTALL